MVKSKKSIMGVAALLILIFHFYIPFFRNVPFEKLLSSNAYIGVDLFFLVSAASSAGHRRTGYGSFVKNRIQSVWLPFALFAVVGTLYQGWGWQKLLLDISGVNLFRKGGAAFLWFFPGIMIFYLLTPMLLSLKERYMWKAFAGLFAAWLALVLVLQHGLHYTTLFILLNRFPIYLIGLYLAEAVAAVTKRISKKGCTVLTIAGFVGGLYALLYLGTALKGNPLLAESMYLLAIPLTLALTAMIEWLAPQIPIRIFAWIGGFTLELYALQMIFGYKLIRRIAKQTGTTPAAFFIMAVILILAAAGVSFAGKRIRQYNNSLYERRKEL